MPDQWNFDHLMHMGSVYHRCVEEGCTATQWGVTIPEKERRKHWEKHERVRQAESQKRRDAALKAARNALNLQRKEKVV
jgi:hypothetical protein